MKKIFSIFPLLILVSGISVFAQEVSEEDPKVKAAELQKEAVKFLRETTAEINTLRTAENRISFSSELANLMWYHDEKESRKMFSGVADSFVQLLTDTNARVDALGGTREENERFGGFSLATDERGKAIRKLLKAVAVREQVVLSIAEHDAQLAYDFLVRTTATITDKNLAASFTEQDERLEKQIIDRMGGRNVEESLAFGRRSLKRGFSPELVGLAEKIYRKDPDAAIEFGRELVDKVRSEAGTDSESFSNIYSVLNAHRTENGEMEKGKKPLFDESALEDLAELMARNLIRAEEFQTYMLDEYLTAIEKYSPSLASRVKAHFDNRKSAEEKAAEAARDAVAKLDMAEANRTSPQLSAEQAAEQALRNEESELMRELQKFGNNELSKEQKAKFIARARRIVSEMKDPTVKIAALTTLAGQVKILGDGELAAEIMREANGMVNPDPQNFMDYMLVWSLAAGYSQVAPEEAFPILENAIYRLNETIDAGVKVARFVDVQGEIVIDGEIQLGAFGGSMIRSALGMVSQSGGVLAALAEEDFERTKALALSFEKPEVRVLARFMVLRSVLVKSETDELQLVKIGR